MASLTCAARGNPENTANPKAEARLARAYLEEFCSSMVAKRTAGHLGKKADPVHQAARARWKEVRGRA